MCASRLEARDRQGRRGGGGRRALRGPPEPVNGGPWPRADIDGETEPPMKPKKERGRERERVGPKSHSDERGT